jgi:putative FmdB family regulatory protein
LPLYEYKCVKCGHQFEKIESLSAPVTKKCPTCGHRAERMASAPAIQFKGSGWYVTDYGGKKTSVPSGEASTASPAAGNGDNSGSGQSEKTSEKSGESKSTESKPESKSSGSDPSNKGVSKRKK